jgi:hypothetical protein
VVTHRPPARPVVTYCPPARPVVTHCPPVRPGVTVGVSLPRPSIAFPSVQVGNHRLPLPPVPVFKRR